MLVHCGWYKRLHTLHIIPSLTSSMHPQSPKMHSSSETNNLQTGTSSDFYRECRVMVACGRLSVHERWNIEQCKSGIYVYISMSFCHGPFSKIFNVCLVKSAFYFHCREKKKFILWSSIIFLRSIHLLYGGWYDNDVCVLVVHVCVNEWVDVFCGWYLSNHCTSFTWKSEACRQ